NDYAPRIGVAWRPLKQTVVRAGYGINYNLAQYANIIQNFAFQPPFAVTATNVNSGATPLTLANGFPAIAPGAVTNNYAIDPNYIYSKSIDDASSIGGGAVVVAQDPFDIAADRGLSIFDQRHKFSGNWIYELPFGENHRFASRGALSHILDGWQWSGDFTIG